MLRKKEEPGSGFRPSMDLELWEELKAQLSGHPGADRLIKGMGDVQTIDYKACAGRTREFEAHWRSYQSQDEEYLDIEALTARHLRTGSSVIQPFHDNDNLLPSFILSRIGPSGRLLILSSDVDEKAQEASLVRAYAERETNHLRFVTERGFVDSLGGLTEGRTNLRSLGMQMERIHIPPLPRHIKAASVDAVINGCGSWDYVGDEDAREILKGFDRALRPGGVLITEEGPREQARLEYLMGQVHDGYASERMLELLNPYNWLVLRKPPH